MVQDNSHILLNNLLYSCVDKVRRSNEQFVPDHSLGYIIAGETHVKNQDGLQVVKEGTIGLVKRNQLVKSIKVPPAEGDFKAINIFFSQDMLRRYCTEHKIQTPGKYTGAPFRLLPDDPFLKGYFNSLMPYFNEPGRMNNALAELKTKEAIELILRINPALGELLFDFSEPYKIDLEAFMLQHYTYNVSLSAFARLTGRSLAGFKRDFEKVFSTSPGQWLQQKRLDEAYYLIREKGVRPSSAYLEVGFENLSHFSFAFKKAFGIAPSSLGVS